MENVAQNREDGQAPAPMGFDDMPRTEEGLIDFRRLAVMLVELVVNAAMDMAADELLGEGNRRNGYRERRLMTVIGEITLRIPKLREGSYFPEEVMRPYSRADRAMVGVVSEVYRLGLSTRKIEKAAADLGFGRLPPSTVSRMTSSLDGDVEELTTAELDGEFPYLWLDATYVSCRNEGGRVEGAAVATAIAAGADGSRRYVGAACVDAESRDSWRGFLLDLRRRGLRGVRLVVSDAHAGLRRAIREVFPGASWQRCVAHLERDVMGRIRARGDSARAGRALAAVFREDDPALVRAAYGVAVREVGAIDRRAGELLEDAREDALCHLSFPREHRARIRTNNVQERANREIKRRTAVVQVFPSRRSLMRLVCAVLADQNDAWSAGRFMDAEGMRDLDRDAASPAPTEETLRRAELIVTGALEEAA